MDMADRPIIFSGPMVQALLSGRKSQTRRVLKLAGRAPEFIGPKGCESDPTCWGWEMPQLGGYVTVEGDDKNHLPGWRNGWRDWQGACAPGDRLYVREAHSLHRAHGQDFKPGGFDHGKRWGPWSGLPIAVSPDKTQVAYYREGFDRSGPPKWRPSIHMPRWASRITLTVTEVRVQRLQDISEADAVAEGCAWSDLWEGFTPCPDGGDGRFFGGTAVASYASLWNSLHGPDAWARNDWVRVLTFTTEQRNIDEATP